MSKQGWRSLIAGVTTLAVATSLVMVVAMGSAAAPDYGPGVAMLQRWWDAGTRGDKADDADLLAAAEAAAADAVDRRSFTLDGAAKTVVAVGTPSGAVALVVQKATSSSDGETTIAPHVSLPVAVSVWFDRAGDIYNTQRWYPVSQGESATEPDNGELIVGMWANERHRQLVLLDTGYSVHFRNGILKPRYSSRNDLLRQTERQKAEFDTDGVSIVTPKDRVLPGTARLSLRQPEGLRNYPTALGAKEDWPRQYRHGSSLHIGFESGGGEAPRIRPLPAAYENERKAFERSRRWTLQRVEMRLDLWSLVLQAQLPGGQQVFMRNLYWGEAYVALVRFPDRRVVGVRCTTPGPILTASCRLPRQLGRVFATYEPFSWKDGGRTWTDAHAVAYNTYAAIVPRGSTIKVEPRRGDPFVLYR